MIQIEEESPELYENTGEYELCIFCDQETKNWHTPTNTPVCYSCAEKHTLKELKATRKKSYQL